MGYCIQYLKQKDEKKLFEIYVTDALKIIADNTAKMGHGGMAIKERYIDMLNSRKAPKKPVESADSIVNRIKSKLGAMGKRGRK